MKFNAKGLNLEELYKWEADLTHLSNTHSCPKIRENYKQILKEVKISIDKKKNSCNTK